ncbi:MAG TPA: NAD(P)/FAD-dependent oxidoreductase [Pyrinomonadaceae bacterium]|nr:NAD(P)/FAD-dependent oxidoreductase [Pyrinomonadaceae bacterium]
MYDAIIVGARCAGSPLAMLLARKGYRVLVVDRSTFPSDTISTHHIHQPGVARLERWGLLERLRATNCPPTTAMSFDVGPFALRGAQPPADGAAEAYAPRRTVLDQMLVAAAAEAGAEVREGFTVEGLIEEGGRVAGIRGAGRGGRGVTERARVVVGADGRASFVARAVGAPAYRERPVLTCNYYSYWSGVELEMPMLYVRERRFMVADRTNDGLTMVCVVWPAEEFNRVRADAEGNFMRSLDLAPDLAARVRAGRREEPLRGTGQIPNFFRKACGPGWALVGDAGYFKDPLTAQGISDSFKQAEWLAEALDEGFTGRLPLDEALARCWRRRDDESLPMYEHTCQLAALAPPPPEMRELFAALRENPAETSRFFGTVSGATDPREFFSPENIRRIVGPATLRPAA